MITIEEATPAPCRHCGRIVTYVDDSWVDAQGMVECEPGLRHEAMPDEADQRLAIAQAMDPEAFR